jgi:hypothetical protein
MSTKPKLFLDVDGVLNADPHDHNDPVPVDFAMGKGNIYVDDRHEAWLAHLLTIFDIHWLTSWEAYANEIWSPLLGLPELPVLKLNSVTRKFSEDTISIKARIVRVNTNGEPFVWLDDQSWFVLRGSADPERYFNGFAPFIDDEVGIDEALYKRIVAYSERL